MNRYFQSKIGIFLAFLLTAGWAAAQSGQGEITGLVKDPSGAGIPSATLTLTNEDSGVTQSITTSPEGRYLFAAVPVGRYSVKVEVAGFKPVTATGIDLVIDQHVIHDFQMTVGTVTVLAVVAVVAVDGC